jgi:hypothetical protein
VLLQVPQQSFEPPLFFYPYLPGGVEWEVSEFRLTMFDPGAEPAFTSLVLATWLYHFCQAGAAVMITATSLAALGTGVLPRWLALVGFVVALLTLLHFLLPLVGALAGLSWVALVSGLMLVGSGRASSPRRLAR